MLNLYHHWSYLHQMLCYDLCITLVLEEPLIFVILNWQLLIYENLIFQFLIYISFWNMLSYLWSKNLCKKGILWNKLISLSDVLNQKSLLQKSCKFLSSGVVLKSHNNVKFSYVSIYMERLLDKPSKNRDFGLEVYTHILSAIFSNRGLFIDTVISQKCFHWHTFMGLLQS